ncbi:peroxiredoxin [Microlunatus parietis]|uniref:Peroxiredoxin n=1 Tax=Microlunatus parietis TaxID=682979 RepID=A0A7Y9LAU1_9ACTN|nr:peroxiredoxin [Microlunatus parietis]NYE69945.1 peroxiredoxin [Microlunatus parietis]
MPVAKPPTEPVVAGAVAPDFRAPNQHGQEIRLSALRGRRVALVFYPWAFSSICTSELSELRDLAPRLADRELTVLALSCDAMFTLRAYADTEGLAFDLVSDWWPHGRIAQAYGVFDAELGCARRGTFLIEADGTVVSATVTPIGERRDLSALLLD